MFDSLHEAKAFANRTVAERNMVDCVLYDHAEQFIEEIFATRSNEAAG